MKKIEDMLENLKIPQLDDKYQFNALRSDILQRFFSNQRQYIIRYRWAVSIAAAMFIVLAVTFLVPNFAQNVNTLVFGDNTDSQTVIVENSPKSKGIVLDENSTADSYSTANLIEDNKTYLIRRYKSPHSGKIMIVSEYEKTQNSNKIRKVSASCY